MAAESDSPRSKKPRRECDYEERFEITTQLDKSDTESRDSNTSCSTNTEIVPISGGSTQSSPTLTHSDSHGQSSSTDHSVLSQSTLPEKLSNWTRKHIEDLNIKTAYQPDTTPFTLITRPVPCTGEIGIRVLTYDVEGIKNREKEKKKKVSILADFVKRSGFLDMIQNLNCSSFEELNIDSMLKLNSYKDSCFLPKGLPENLEAWFRRQVDVLIDFNFNQFYTHQDWDDTVLEDFVHITILEISQYITQLKHEEGLKFYSVCRYVTTCPYWRATSTRQVPFLTSIL